MDEDDHEDQVEIEYITEDMELTNPYFRSFSQIFERFKVHTYFICILLFFFVFFSRVFFIYHIFSFVS